MQSYPSAGYIEIGYTGENGEKWESGPIMNSGRKVWCFRIRFSLTGSSKIGSAEEKWVLWREEEERIFLKPSGDSGAISETGELALYGEGYESYSEAVASSEKWRDWMSLALASQAIGAEFGDRSRQGGLTENFLGRLRESAGRNVANDILGVYVYKLEDCPIFVDIRAVGVAHKSPGGLKDSLDFAAENSYRMANNVSLAYNLYSISRSIDSDDIKFIILTTAVEAFIKEKSFSEESREFVSGLIRQAKEACVPEGERQSIEGRLGGLKKESISQAGRRLARELSEGGGGYFEGDPEDFFKRIYNIRSGLVHASSRRSDISEVRSMLPSLELFVRGLIDKSKHV